MDETYIKIKGKWYYYYRAVDENGDIIDFYANLIERLRQQRCSLLKQ